MIRFYHKDQDGQLEPCYIVMMHYVPYNHMVIDRSKNRSYCYYYTRWICRLLSKPIIVSILIIRVSFLCHIELANISHLPYIIRRLWETCPLIINKQLNYVVTWDRQE